MDPLNYLDLKLNYYFKESKKDMPQLDTASQLPQIFSLMLVFSGFQIIVQKNILPTLGTILKVRTKKLSEGQDLIENMEAENSQIAVEQDKILSTSLKESGELLQNTAADSSSWVNENLKNTSTAGTAQVSTMNTLQLNTMGEIAAKKRYFATSMPR